MRPHILQLFAAALIGSSLLAQAPEAIAQTSPELTKKVMQMERDREKEFEDYFGEDLASVTKTADQTATELAALSSRTGARSALLYVIPRKTHLHLVLITPNGTPIVKDFYETTDPLLFKTARQFHRSIIKLDQAATKETGKQLYDWIIAPYRDELEAAQIELILFCLGDGVKDLALPALFDGRQYLIESYAITRIPAFNLIDTRHRPFRSGSLLAMGASSFEDKRISALPGTRTEIAAIDANLRKTPDARHWRVSTLEDESFTQSSINSQFRSTPYTTLHITTHAQFKPGSASDSYIQLWDKKLTLKTLNQIDWEKSRANLLVLSACQTAIGDKDAANGFAGLALKAGIPTAIGTLWSINDRSSAELISDFYEALPISETKAQALQDAQISMLQQYKEPYYWAGFSLISAPW